MDNHADASEVYTKLVRLNGVGYEVFELPSGPFFLFADDLALRMAAFEGSIDEKDLSRVIPRRRNAPIRAALKFLDSYLHGMKAPLPPLDLSAYTGAEKAVYRSLMAVPFAVAAGVVPPAGAVLAASGSSSPPQLTRPKTASRQVMITARRLVIKKLVHQSHEDLELVVVHPMPCFLDPHRPVIVKRAQIQRFETRAPALFAPDDQHRTADLVPEVARILHVELIR